MDKTSKNGHLCEGGRWMGGLYCRVKDEAAFIVSASTSIALVLTLNAQSSQSQSFSPSHSILTIIFTIMLIFTFNCVSSCARVRLGHMWPQESSWSPSLSLTAHATHPIYAHPPHICPPTYRPLHVPKHFCSPRGCGDTPT